MPEEAARFQAPLGEAAGLSAGPGSSLLTTGAWAEAWGQRYGVALQTETSARDWKLISVVSLIVEETVRAFLQNRRNVSFDSETPVGRSNCLLFGWDALNRNLTSPLDRALPVYGINAEVRSRLVQRGLSEHLQPWLNAINRYQVELARDLAPNQISLFSAFEALCCAWAAVDLTFHFMTGGLPGLMRRVAEWGCPIP